MTTATVTYTRRHSTYTFRPISKTEMMVSVDGADEKQMTINNFSLTRLDIPSSEQGALLYDIREVSGKGNAPKVTEIPITPAPILKPKSTDLEFDMYDPKGRYYG